MIWILLVCLIGIIVALAAAVLFLPISMSVWVEHVQDATCRQEDKSLIYNEFTTNYRIAIRWPFSLFGVGIYGGGSGRSLQLLLGEKVIHKRKRKDRKRKKDRSGSRKESEKKKKGRERTPKESKKREKKKKTTRRQEDKSWIYNELATKEKFAGIQTLLENRELASEALRPIVRFLKRIIRCIRRFCLSGDVEVGFSDPALMGFLYGIFWATVGCSRFFTELKITPNYVDTVFEGWLQFSVIVTLSRIPWALLLLIIALPKRKLWKLRKKIG